MWSVKKSKKKTIEKEVTEMPKTAKEAVERYEEMFEGKRIISERFGEFFDIQCFLFDKTKPAEEKDGKWVQRKVLKVCQ
ncbi:Protein CBG01989 [Caenorhabditis briggsae]|uniref:Protein CBG01989 n=1 Tax=Caenorhabditis briggsae TaxID=6238 RepID=A8WRR3_CAEBR|nr:Protein CBG01989 [Caenorhabditis briggsae]CAP23171.2 Protein CBG01989 [Caenorhabditis briggsae]